MEKQKAFFEIMQLIPKLQEYQKKQLALILIGQTLTEMSEFESHQLSRLQRFK